MTPVYFEHDAGSGLPCALAAITTLKEKHLINKGDKVIITQGDVMDLVGSTNCMRIIEVE